MTGRRMAQSAATRLDRGAWSWAVFEAARNPYVILCLIYVLGPYITTTVIGDPVRGQVIISGWHRTAGIIVALLAPFLGAASDRMGQRKPLLGALALGLAVFTFIQFWALPPGEGGLPLWALGAAVTIAGACYSLSEVPHNSMLTSAAPPQLVPRASGMGLAFGNLASVLLLIFTLVWIALPGQVDWPFVPAHPLFGLDPAKHEPSRSAAIICSLWLVVFALPLFLWTRDLNATGEKFFIAMRHGVGQVARTLVKLRDFRNIALFLLARMLYADGTTAVIIFGGVYAAGVMGWGLIELLALGIILSSFGVFGGLVGAWLDERIGAKRAIAVEVGLTLLCLIAMVSMSADRMFFVIAVDPAARAWDGPVFQAAPEIAYICVSALIAVTITGAYSSSRTFLTQLSPPNMTGEMFGLYALSGSATAWLGPSLVEVFTDAYHSQKAGFASIGALLLAGFVLLLFVKPPRS